MAALNAAFLPALILSGFIYEIRSMPLVIRGVTYLVPARYFVTRHADAVSGRRRSGRCCCRACCSWRPPRLFFIGLTALKTRRRLE